MNKLKLPLFLLLSSLTFDAICMQGWRSLAKSPQGGDGGAASVTSPTPAESARQANKVSRGGRQRFTKAGDKAAAVIATSAAIDGGRPSGEVSPTPVPTLAMSDVVGGDKADIPGPAFDLEAEARVATAEDIVSSMAEEESWGDRKWVPTSRDGAGWLTSVYTPRGAEGRIENQRKAFQNALELAQGLLRQRNLTKEDREAIAEALDAQEGYKRYSKEHFATMTNDAANYRAHNMRPLPANTELSEERKEDLAGLNLTLEEANKNGVYLGKSPAIRAALKKQREELLKHRQEEDARALARLKEIMALEQMAHSNEEMQNPSSRSVSPVPYTRDQMNEMQQRYAGDPVGSTMV